MTYIGLYNIYIYIYTYIHIYIYYIYIRDDWYYDWYILQWLGKCCWEINIVQIDTFELEHWYVQGMKNHLHPLPPFLRCLLFSPPPPEEMFPDHKIGQTERYAAAAMSGSLADCWGASQPMASPTNVGTTSSWDFTIQVGYKTNTLW